MELVLSGNILPDVRVDPDRLSFAAGKPAKARIKLTAGEVKAFAVRGVYSDQRSIRGEYLPESSEVEVTYDPHGEQDNGPRCILTIETDSERERSIRISIELTR